MLVRGKPVGAAVVSFGINGQTSHLPEVLVIVQWLVGSVTVELSGTRWALALSRSGMVTVTSIFAVVMVKVTR